MTPLQSNSQWHEFTCSQKDKISLGRVNVVIFLMDESTSLPFSSNTEKTREHFLSLTGETWESVVVALRESKEKSATVQSKLLPKQIVGIIELDSYPEKMSENSEAGSEVTKEYNRTAPGEWLLTNLTNLSEDIASFAYGGDHAVLIAHTNDDLVTYLQFGVGDIVSEVPLRWASHRDLTPQSPTKFLTSEITLTCNLPSTN